MVNMLIEESFKHFMGIDQPYLATLYTTIFSTAYYGLLKIGEIAAGTHPILATNVQIGINKKKIMIILQTSTRKPVGFMQSCGFVFVGILSTYK